MIHREMRGPIAIVRMQHGKANALDTELCAALADAFEGLAAAGARAVVLTGSGSIFCAGVDLFRVVEGGAGYVEVFFPALRRLFRTVFECPLPVVAAANGHAIAGGCVVMCACDHRIMCGGRAGIPELIVGVPFPTMGLEVMRFATPPQHAQRIIYGGDTWEAPRALELGLADEVVEPQKLMDRALAVAGEYAAIPQRTFELTKLQQREPVLRRVDAAEPATDPSVIETWGAPETLAAIRAYMERVIGKREGPASA